MKEDLIQNIGKEIKVYTLEGYRYVGTIKSVDDTFLSIIDYRVGGLQYIRLAHIASFSLPNKGTP